MRSVVVFHIGGVGGPQRSLDSAVGWLRERGTVDFIVPEAGDTADRFGRYGAVAVADYSALTYSRGVREGAHALRRLVRDVRMFRAELRRRGAEMVVVVTTVLPAALIAARLERVPSVVYAAEIYQQEWKRSPLLRLWGALLANGTSCLAGGVVCCSAAVSVQFPDRGGKPLAIAHPPIGPEYAAGDRERGRARLGLDGADPAIAVVGSISRGRGQDTALRAFALIRRRLPSARLVVVGAPHRRPADIAFARELRELARELGVAEAVEFHGLVDPIADVYAAVDLVVNPARFAEPFGRVAPEALVAGRPVVASAVGAVPSVIRDGVDGVLVEPDDPGALASAVLDLAADPERARTLVATGGPRMLAEFGYDQDRRAWRGVFERVLADSGRRPRVRRAATAASAALVVGALVLRGCR